MSRLNPFYTLVDPKKIYWYLLAFCFTLSEAKSAVVLLNDSLNQLMVSNKHVEYYEDKSNVLTIEDFLNVKKSILFKRTESECVIIKNPSSTYWVRFSVKNNSENKKWLLENYDSHIGKFTCYVLYPDGKIIEKTAGYGLDFKTKPFDHKNFIFDIFSTNNDEVTIFIKGKSNFHNAFLLYFRSLNSFINYSLDEYLLLGIFYGILVIMIIYNFALYFTIKENIYIYYCLYVISAMLVSLAEDGLGFQYLWPHFPEMNVFLFNYAPVLYVSTYILYSTSFLELKKYSPLTNDILLGVGFTFACYFIAKNSGLRLPWNNSLYLIPFLFIYVTTLILRAKEIKLIHYFIIANSIIIVTLLITFLRMAEIIRSSAVPLVYAFNIGLLLEIVMFSIMMSERFRLIKAEKQDLDRKLIAQLEDASKLKDKLNEELEIKVEERTRELADSNAELISANELLQIQAEKIESMNQLLKNENVSLQTNLVELVRARVMLQEVNFTEFSRLFPDNETCIEYLANLKWKNGYTCKKCGNTKHVSTVYLLSRRCTKCRYTESATSFTIFQKCKFPLNKAFYILFLVYASKDKITSLELSMALQLRLSTCWQFSRKVKAAMESKRRFQYEKEGYEKWEALIPTDFE